MNIIRQVDLRTQSQLCGVIQAAALLDILDSQVLILAYEGRSPYWISRQLPLDVSEVDRRLLKIQAVIAEHIPERSLEPMLITTVRDAMRKQKNGKARGLRCLCRRKFGDSVSCHCAGCGLLNPRFDPLAFFNCTRFTIEKIREERCYKRQHVISASPQDEPYCVDCGARSAG